MPGPHGEEGFSQGTSPMRVGWGGPWLMSRQHMFTCRPYVALPTSAGRWDGDPHAVLVWTASFRGSLVSLHTVMASHLGAGPRVSRGAGQCISEKASKSAEGWQARGAGRRQRARTSRRAGWESDLRSLPGGLSSPRKGSHGPGPWSSLSWRRLARLSSRCLQLLSLGARVLEMLMY